MKLARLKIVLLIPLVLFALIYAYGALKLATNDDTVPIADVTSAEPVTVAIFGASGTAGDGILKAAMASPDIGMIHVYTRRATERMEAGVAAGTVQVTLHQDYLDYSPILEDIVGLDAVYWAIGTSTVGVDEETYGRIHVDFPMRFVESWLAASDKPDISFHYISSSDLSEDSGMMWVQQKLRAERSLIGLAEGTKLRVIAYRPDYIGPTEEEAHLGQNLLYWFFAPVGAAVRATSIGQAMIDVTVRGKEFENGRKLGTASIIRYSSAYERRQK